MGWTVIKIDEMGKEEKTLSGEFEIDNFNSMDLSEYKLLKYLDPYGNTTFNSRQFHDLKTDLIKLERKLIVNQKTLQELLDLLEECSHDSHSYLKFYGD